MPLLSAQEIATPMLRVGVAEDKAREWSTLIADDLRRFGLEEFRLCPLDYVSGNMGLVEYEFGPTAYSVDHAKPTASPNFQPSDHGGTQLDRENLLLFARVSEIARSRAANIWVNPDDELKGKLTSPRQHLDTLNEFWWLSRWRQPLATLEQNQIINPLCGMDVDWRLHWDMGLNTSLFVNLEVKRRAGGDVLRFAQGATTAPEQLFSAGLEKNGRCKFRPSNANEINVLGVTLLGEINRDVQAQAGDWIKSRNDIDALLLFSRFSQNRSGFDVHAVRKRELLDAVLVRSLDPLDQSLHGRVATPLPFSLNQLPFLP